MSIERPPVPGLPSLSDPDSGGRVDDLGRHLVETSPQAGTDLHPYAGVQDRPMLGGLRTAHHPGLLLDPPRFTGGHIELVNRRSVVILAPHEDSTPDASPVLPSLRVPPVSDPYGRMCANAAAASGAGR